MSKIIKSVVFMFIVTLGFTSLVTVVRITNQERIERNQKVKLQRTILGVLGLNEGNILTPQEISATYKNRIKQTKLGNRTVYVCYGDDGKTVSGYAFPVEGPGFWGPVYAMAAVNPEATKLLGISFYRHSETPGLGARISEKWFTDQFKEMPLEFINNKKQYFTLTPGRDDRKPNEFDAITGASRTSDAVEFFLNRELKAVVDKLRDNAN
jgi:Na+-transporting NADH:ubiquinone oxidoreductase subunit C